MTPFWKGWLRREEWDEELESHIAMRSEWNQRQLGLTPEQGAELARRQFGGKLRLREKIEDLYRPHFLADFIQDLRHTFRLLRFAPGFAFLVIATIAAGIAGSTTVFSIVDPLLFRSLPFSADQQLVSVGVNGPIDANEFAMANMYVQWRDHQTVFSSLTAMRTPTQCDLEFSHIERLPCVSVQQNFLPTLGVAPLAGRNFTLAEDQPNAPKTLLISDRIWRNYFGSRPDAIGTLVKLDNAWARIIGVLPANFELPEGNEVELLQPSQLDERTLHDPAATIFLRAFARLKPGISAEQARQRMMPLFQQSIRATVPAEVRHEIRPIIRSVRDRITHGAIAASRMLLGAVGLLLVMSCLTVTNLMLARAHNHRNEFAMRAALGAGRSRLVRQCLTETLVLSFAGGALGFAMSCICVRLLVHAAPDGFLQLDKVHFDPRALAFSAAGTLFVTLLAGLVPSVRLPEGPLQSSRATTAGAARLRQTLISLQLACSLVLLTGALLFARSLSHLETAQTGFSQNQLATISFSLSRSRYQTPERRFAFDNQIESRLKALPGIQAVALSDSMPPAGSVVARPLSNIKVFGQDPLIGASGMVALRYVTPDYFRALQIPVLRGRTFTEAERNVAQQSLVISASLAHRLFSSADPIGGRVSLNGGTSWVTVIGVVRDVKNDGIAAPTLPEYYLLRTNPSAARERQRLGLTTVAFVRSSLPVSTLRRWVQDDLAAIDPTVTTELDLMPEHLLHLADRPRFITLVLVIFATGSLILAAGGLYGVIAFLVNSRARELAIRATLGATRRNILLMVQRQTLLCAGVGVLVGLCGSVTLASSARSLLFEIGPRDPTTLAAAALCLLTISFLAALGPSLTATHIDPAKLLRAE
ncbi:MAG: ABC transporter permease [Acidobacteriaceae bacterium]|nr:ABC transporter permease [Acidobacteriaceae bacterium]